MLAAWTWDQLIYEIGIAAACAIVIACLGYFSQAGVRIVRKEKRFGLLDLLVAITLIGALAGVVAGLAREDKNGIQSEFGPIGKGGYVRPEDIKQMKKQFSEQ